MPKRFAKVFSVQPEYLSAKIITIEVDISRGMHSFSIVGLPDKAVEEARDRVGSAIKNTGFKSPKNSNQKTIVSLAPAGLKKEGAFFDLAIAIGYLLASSEITFNSKDKVFVGELGLDGSVHSVRGALMLAQEARDAGFQQIFVPAENAEEAALIEDIEVYPVKTLAEVVAHLDATQKEDEDISDSFLITKAPLTKISTTKGKIIIDFADVRGQETAKRGLEIAAAGGHNVAMSGPPGTGKTMLARAFSFILPKLGTEEVLEITGIHSVSGASNGELITTAPFRSPHHTSSYVSIVGGGAKIKPGEVTLSHRGVLFLDEFPEFDKKVLESLRQPLEDRIVTISRARGRATFPANFILVAAMNPCPCGNWGSEHKICTCTAGDIARYRRKISGPIIDRIDIWLTVEHIDYEKLSSSKESEKGEKSEDIIKRIQKAREKQAERFARFNIKKKLNSEMGVKEIEKLGLGEKEKELLNTSARSLTLSPRAYHRVIKLARTIADLDNSEKISENHILEALQYRPRLEY